MTYQHQRCERCVEPVTTKIQSTSGAKGIQHKSDGQALQQEKIW